MFVSPCKDRLLFGFVCQMTNVSSGPRVSPSRQQTLRGGSGQSHHISRPEHTVSIILLDWIAFRIQGVSLPKAHEYCGPHLSSTFDSMNVWFAAALAPVSTGSTGVHIKDEKRAIDSFPPSFYFLQKTSHCHCGETTTGWTSHFNSAERYISETTDLTHWDIYLPTIVTV